ncbi:unnamed protein product [Dovyalis caffra]|uniref:Uncharacterized protein n=1 Tax=Dovyalis caffra TaxID=77055 RepID=A0AAV1QS79_9ROSI|nr:unnamed protein product [Dovyalis caffra]
MAHLTVSITCKSSLNSKNLDMNPYIHALDIITSNVLDVSAIVGPIGVLEDDS